MGQKIHPLGFRLGITQPHYSNWYASPLKYANFVHEDYILRTYLQKVLKTAKLGNIEINRLIDQTEIKLAFSDSGQDKEKDKKLFETLHIQIEKHLKKHFPYLQKKQNFIRLKVEKIEIPEFNASLVAQFVAGELEKRVAFRKAMRQALNDAKKAQIQGIKIQVSGRLNGAEMARTEWARHGRVPLQTLRARIDYAHHEANTLYGVIGVKVWVFKGESLD